LPRGLATKPPPAPLTGDELVRVVQGGGDVRTTTGAIAALAVAGGGGTSWFAITGKPTTLLGYGIVDAVSIAALNTALALKISVSASGTFGRTLLATGAASTARLALGLGTMALEETTSYYNKGEVDDLIDGVTVGGGGAIAVGSVEDLRDVPAVEDLPALCTQSGREGIFIYSESDLSAEVAADTGGLRYIAPTDDLTGASGAWVRKPIGADSACFTDDTITVPAIVRVFRTEGYATPGDGGAKDYAYDPAVDATYVAAHPTTAFLASDGRGFKELPSSSFTPAEFQDDTVAADLAALKVDFNALLAKLQAAGIMDDGVVEPPPGDFAYELVTTLAYDAVAAENHTFADVTLPDGLLVLALLCRNGGAHAAAVAVDAGAASAVPGANGLTSMWLYNNSAGVKDIAITGTGPLGTVGLAIIAVTGANATPTQVAYVDANFTSPTPSGAMTCPPGGLLIAVYGGSDDGSGISWSVGTEIVDQALAGAWETGLFGVAVLEADGNFSASGCGYNAMTAIAIEPA
jgi:hypothetical protein